MGNEEISKSDNKDRFWFKLIIAAGVIFLSLIIFVFHNQLPMGSEPAIIEAAARQLNKDPNEFTKKDFAKITELCIAEKALRGFSGIGSDIETYRRTEISNISLLVKFVNLESLDLSYLNYPKDKMTKTNIEKPSFDLSPIKKLTKLRNLKIDNTPICDINSLASLTNLESLTLSRTTHNFDIKPLTNLTYLKSLDLHGTQISDIEPLANLTKLESLDLSNTQITDISILAGLTNLKSLNLSSTNISDLKSLANLDKLESLKLDHSQNSDFDTLKALTNLRELSMFMSNISNLEPISKLTKLQKLIINDTHVTNLEPLEKLTSLQELYIAKTTVTNLEPLKGLTNLKKLNIQLCNNISSAQVDELKNTFPNLNIISALRQ